MASSILLTAAGVFVFLAYGTTSVVARRLGARLDSDSLRREVETSALARQGLSARQASIAGAFVARPALAGHRVLLVDDLVATGWTLTLASRALLTARASAVLPLTLATET